MKYNLDRPIGKKEINPIIKREIRRLKIRYPTATRKILNEIDRVSLEIKENGLPSRFICRKLPFNLGKGIFLHPKASPIQRGEVIASYAGKFAIVPQNDAEDSDYAFAPISDMLLTKEEQAEFDPKRRFHPRRLYALDLDAAQVGNLTRFINHSEKPNVEARLLKIPKNQFGLTENPAEIVYIANKTIHPGEQLLVCYEDEEKGYWGILGIKPYPMGPKTFLLDEDLRLKIHRSSRQNRKKRFKR